MPGFVFSVYTGVPLGVDVCPVSVYDLPIYALMPPPLYAPPTPQTNQLTAFY